MFERITQAAEQVAANVSRRRFLGKLGRGATTLAAFLGGMLLAPGDALAAPGQCCFCYVAGSGISYCYRRRKGQRCENDPNADCYPGKCQPSCTG